MRQNVLHSGIAFLVLLLLFWLLPGLFIGLESGDETRVAGIVMESFLRRDWLVPRLNGELFLEYPSLFYAWGCLIFQLCGAGEWSLRLVPLLPACGTVLLLFRAARQLHFSRTGAVLAGVILMTSAQFFSSAACVRVDILLTFLMTLANCGALLLMQESAPAGRRVAGGTLLALGLGGTMVTKGLFGVALLGASWGAVFLADAVMHRRFRWRLFCFFAAAGLASIVPLLLWLWYMAERFGQGVVYEVLVTNGIMRFGGSQGDHVEAWYYYLARSPQIFFPWQLLTLGGVILAVRRLVRHRDRTALLLLSSLLVPLLLLNVAAAKRMVYLLPFAPAAALLAAQFIMVIWRRFGVVRRGMPYLTPLRRLLLLAAVGLLVNGALYLKWRKNQEEDSVALFWRQTEKLAAQENRRIVLFDPFERTRGSAVFYLRRCVAMRITAELPSEPELWVVRCYWRDDVDLFDKHRLFRMPEEMARFKREFVPYPISR